MAIHSRPIWFALGIALTAPAAGAQLPSFAVVGGVSHYDLSGTGSTAIGALRADIGIPLVPVLVEGSFGVMRPKEDNGTRTYIIPEVQLQYQILPILVRPYIGVGGGLFKSVSGPDPQRSEFTGSAAVGVRASIPLVGFGVRAEARLRGIGSGFSGSATELTVGVSF